VTTTVITNTVIVIPEYHTSFAKLSYIFYKVFEIEYKCNSIKSLPNDNRDSDGTWNVCDDFKPIQPCVEYSFGIANDFRFEEAFHRYYGCDVYTFDPSMGQQDHEHSKGVQFYNRGLSFEKSDSYRGSEYGRADRVQYWKVDTVGGYMKTFNHDHGAVLKIDTEGAEWDALIQSLGDGTLQKFDQLLFEIHLWNFQNVDQTIDKWFRLFKGLENQSFQLFYSHVNPQSTTSRFPNHYYVPCCYELSFMRTNALNK